MFCVFVSVKVTIGLGSQLLVAIMVGADGTPSQGTVTLPGTATNIGGVAVGIKEMLSMEKSPSGLVLPLSSAQTMKRLSPGAQAKEVKAKVLVAEAGAGEVKS